MQSRVGLGSRALIALAMAVGLVVGALVATAGDGGRAGTAQAAGQAASEDPPSTTSPAGSPLSSEVDPSVPLNPRGLSGWGTAQPNSMAATVMNGTSNTRMSTEERQELAGYMEQARAAALEIGTVAGAEARGYVQNFQYVDGRGYEYIKWENFKPELNFDEPTMVNFPDTAPDTRVASVAYQVLGTAEAGPPDVLANVLPWHFHKNLCRKGDSIVGNVETQPDGTLYQRHVERCENLGAEYQPYLDHWMIDLWVVPGWENPWGLVSSKHPDLMRTPVPWFTDTNVEGADVNIPGHHDD